MRRLFRLSCVTIAILGLAFVLVITTSFLRPVSDTTLFSSDWCGYSDLGYTWLVRHVKFTADDTVEYLKLPADSPDYAVLETGTWERSGIRIYMSTKEENSSESLITYLYPIGWGGGLATYGGDYSESGHTPGLFIISPCEE